MTKKANERDQKLVKQLQRFSNLVDLAPAADKFSRWDAESSLFVVEMKTRNKLFVDTIIEKPKYDACMASGKRFLYVVHSIVKNEMYVFDFSKLDEPEWTTGRYNRETEFTSSTRKVEKVVGHIDWNDAVVVINTKTGKLVKVAL